MDFFTLCGEGALVAIVAACLLLQTYFQYKEHRRRKLVARRWESIKGQLNRKGVR